MKRILTILLTVIFCVLGCEDRDDNVNAVNIRIKNVSNLTYGEVQVGDSEKVHMNIAPDAYSEYLEYEEAYQYAFIEIKTDSLTYTLQPIDFVGETPLPLGFYTYELKAIDGGDVELTFKVD